MLQDWRVIKDLDLGVLRARGVDAGAFLQGQLSNDTARLQPGQLQWSGYHNPQGRVIALLRLTPLATDDLLAILPRELVPVVVTRLKRYVLRAKVQITDESQQWQMLGFQGTAPALPQAALALPHGSSRQLLLIPKPAGAPGAGAETGAGSGTGHGPGIEAVVAGTRRDWIACDIAEGLPQVYLPTSEAFVAQMLNLDVIGGIAFDKGCYTGQEIIARAHYRGQVKRRMQRFVTAAAAALTPGETVNLPDGRSCRIVEAAQRADGRCEFLGVAPLTAAADGEADAGSTHPAVNATALALPYAPALQP